MSLSSQSVVNNEPGRLVRSWRKLAWQEHAAAWAITSHGEGNTALNQERSAANDFPTLDMTLMTTTSFWRSGRAQGHGSFAYADWTLFPRVGGLFGPFRGHMVPAVFRVLLRAAWVVCAVSRRLFRRWRDSGFAGRLLGDRLCCQRIVRSVGSLTSLISEADTPWR